MYYTTAEVAFQILSSGEMWLRNAMLMNDFSEASHGFDCLYGALSSAPGAALNSALAACFPDLPGRVEEMCKTVLPAIREDTYLTSFSEHHPTEDARGRLSMWRAYGGPSGVAVVFNGAVLHSTSNAVGAYASPVLYADRKGFGDLLLEVAALISKEVDFLRTIGENGVTNAVFHVLRSSAFCTKHPGFGEELEWRIIASPMIYSTERLRRSLEVIRGVPQKVLRISFASVPEEGRSMPCHGKR